MQDAAEGGKCVSGPGGTCQFSGMGVEAKEFNSKYYCKFHAPPDAPFKSTVNEIQGFLDTGSPAPLDMTGVVFPGPYKTYSFRHDAIARKCWFGANLTLQSHQTLDITGSTCAGWIDIDAYGSRLIARSTKFEGNLELVAQEAFEVDFRETEVKGEVTLNAVLQSGCRLRFDKATLAYPPRVKLNPPKLPQGTSFRFRPDKRTAFGDGMEGRYRTIRNLFHENRDREQEGIFYAYEKRALRMSLKFGVTRAMSAAYDWFAKYGQSYERALGCLFVLQLLFGLGYCIAAGRLGIGTFDGQVAAFTLAQIVKPFELLSARSASATWPYQGVYSGGNGWWTFAIVVHSVFSLTLVALFLLALRWRFRRD